MSARGARLLALALAALAACRFDTKGISSDAASGDRPVSSDRSAERASDAGRDRAVAEHQAQETSCLDGLDNDGDGLADCADADCLAAGYECAPQAPVSMEGYYRIRKGTWEEPVPACADGSKAGIYGADPVPPTCASCSCGPLTGAECGYPPLHHWTGTKVCSGSGTDVTSTYGKPVCTPGTATGENSVKIVGNAPVVSPGSCPVAGGELLAKKAWSAQIEVCTEVGVGGGCSPGSICLRKAAAGYEPKLCHRLKGGGDCGSWGAITGHADWKDERGCTPCSCQPQTTCSGGSYTFYGDNQSCDSGGCNDPEEIKPGGSCRDFTPSGGSLPFSVTAKKATAGNTSCAPVGGQPIGAIKSTLVTFCCR